MGSCAAIACGNPLRGRGARPTELPKRTFRRRVALEGDCKPAAGRGDYLSRGCGRPPPAFTRWRSDMIEHRRPIEGGEMAVLMTAQIPGGTQEMIDGMRPVLDQITSAKGIIVHGN